MQKPARPGACEIGSLLRGTDPTQGPQPPISPDVARHLSAGTSHSSDEGPQGPASKRQPGATDPLAAPANPSLAWSFPSKKQQRCNHGDSGLGQPPHQGTLPAGRRPGYLHFLGSFTRDHCSLADIGAMPAQRSVSFLQKIKQTRTLGEVNSQGQDLGTIKHLQAAGDTLCSSTRG